MKRIRKDAVVACIVTVLCVGGILFSGCGKETVAQNTQGQNRYDGFCRYDSDDELVEDQISRCRVQEFDRANRHKHAGRHLPVPHAIGGGAA